MPAFLSVVLCTHNPRLDYLRRVVAALQGQTMAAAEWELVIIDNHSTMPVAELVDVTWHPRGRVVREERQGLTHARIRGCIETSGDAIVFVDDDSVLAPDYLKVAQQIAASMPFLGVWSARIRGEFEVAPELWAKPYLPFLALTEFSSDLWSNHPRGGSLPVGAGMVVRREVMAAYREALAQDRSRVRLDRNGTSLLAGGDTDIGRTACAIGLGCGWMKDLRVTHLVAAGRLAPSYLVRLVESVTASHHFLELKGGDEPIRGIKRLKLLAKGVVGRITGPRSRRGFDGAVARGLLRGAALYRASCLSP